VEGKSMKMRIERLRRVGREKDGKREVVVVSK
jgi:hypothetical protein